VSRYTWNPDKARANLRKHGVSFEEAESVLRSPLTSTVDDDVHSGFERRLRVVGYSVMGRLVVVITSEGRHWRRIISARRATKRERDAYERR
jgi:uncharacterized DUF497 family protein